MDQKAIQSVCREVYRLYPQVAGKKPDVKRQTSSSETKSPEKDRYLLVFSKIGSKSTNTPVSIFVRVTADGHGRILKISSSK